MCRVVECCATHVVCWLHSVAMPGVSMYHHGVGGVGRFVLHLFNVAWGLVAFVLTPVHLWQEFWLKARRVAPQYCPDLVVCPVAEPPPLPQWRRRAVLALGCVGIALWCLSQLVLEHGTLDVLRALCNTSELAAAPSLAELLVTAGVCLTAMHFSLV